MYREDLTAAVRRSATPELSAAVRRPTASGQRAAAGAGRAVGEVPPDLSGTSPGDGPADDAHQRPWRRWQQDWRQVRAQWEEWEQRTRAEHDPAGPGDRAEQDERLARLERHAAALLDDVRELARAKDPGAEAVRAALIVVDTALSQVRRLLG